MEYTIDVDRAIESIRNFNSGEPFLACDYSLKEYFRDDFKEIKPDSLSILVVLVDGLWGTQLFRDPRVTEMMVSELKDHWPKVCKVLSDLGENDLKENPEKAYKAAREIFPIILNNNEGHQQHYSFTTKFFHWCTNGHFPIVDSRTRQSINRLQREHGISRGLVLSSTAEMGNRTYLDEYGRWVYFYSDLLRSLSKEDCEKLLAEDEKSQNETNPSLTIKNTLLRVLDKIFYQEGR